MGTKQRGADKQTLRRVLNAMRPLISFQMIVRSTVSFSFSLFMGVGGGGGVDNFIWCAIKFRAFINYYN